MIFLSDTLIFSFLHYPTQSSCYDNHPQIKAVIHNYPACDMVVVHSHYNHITNHVTYTMTQFLVAENQYYRSLFLEH